MLNMTCDGLQTMPQCHDLVVYRTLQDKEGGRYPAVPASCRLPLLSLFPRRPPLFFLQVNVLLVSQSITQQLRRC